MQFFIFLIALIAALSHTTIAASVSSDAAECGALGVMEIPKALPEGVSPSDLRKCSEHPEGKGGLNTNGTSPASGANGNLAALLACQTSPIGCTRGYCWRVCGPAGEWCWTAAQGGLGNWLTCTSFRDCDPNAACGQGGCAACGCSC